jgi:hypothetical protein
MANPGRDVFNMEADDGLAPKRQAEIGQLIETLKRIHELRPNQKSRRTCVRPFRKERGRFF